MQKNKKKYIIRKTWWKKALQVQFHQPTTTAAATETNIYKNCIRLLGWFEYRIFFLTQNKKK